MGSGRLADGKQHPFKSGVSQQLRREEKASSGLTLSLRHSTEKRELPDKAAPHQGTASHRTHRLCTLSTEASAFNNFVNRFPKRGALGMDT
nr:hypothetical protein Iba_chr02bCG10850 [Ipomoea batatas]